MNEERKALLKKIEGKVIPFARPYLDSHGFENYEIKDVFCYRQYIKLVNKQTKQEERFKLYAVQTENLIPEEGKDPSFELECFEDENGNLFTIEELIGRYEEESFKDIGKVVADANKNEKLPPKEQKEALKKDTLEELQSEREQEENKEKKGNIDKTETKKRKPSYVIETVNPDKAKMDYWQNIKQAFGLPAEVATLAFAYPISSEDKVDYANITVYMLDKDGNIIDGLDVDHYFEFDSSTGNNPMQDNVKRHEEDENKGKTQLEEQYTMIRLKAKNGNNTYISLEQKNGFGDYNDINAGRKAVAGTQNVEKQLETDRVRVWDSERELLMRSNAGMFHINNMLEEAEVQEEHGEEEYAHAKNSDGYSHTKVPCSKHIYVIIECLIRLKENEYIRENFSDREIVDKIINTIDKNPNITKDELIDKAESYIIGDKVSEHDWKDLATKWGYYKDGRPDEEKARRVYEEYKYNNPHLSDDEVVQEVSDDLYDQIPGRNSRQ